MFQVIVIPSILGVHFLIVSFSFICFFQSALHTLFSYTVLWLWISMAWYRLARIRKFKRFHYFEFFERNIVYFCLSYHCFLKVQSGVHMRTALIVVEHGIYFSYDCSESFVWFFIVQLLGSKHCIIEWMHVMYFNPMN